MSDMDRLQKIVDELASALQLGGNDDASSRLLDALYGAATGGEMVMKLRYELNKIDKSNLGKNIELWNELNRLLPK